MMEEGPWQEDCVHHWMLAGTRRIRLTREQQLKHPNCIGRQSYCKKCSTERTQLEKVWDVMGGPA